MNSPSCRNANRNERGGLIAPTLEDYFKDFIYVGHYIDVDGNYILKIGTTNNLKRRQGEHNLKYKKSPNHRMPPNGTFEYDFWLPLSKYNTVRYEDKNRALWIEQNVGEYIRNDRFLCKNKPEFVSICIRKEYIVQLLQKKPPFRWLFLCIFTKKPRVFGRKRRNLCILYSFRRFFRKFLFILPS